MFPKCFEWHPFCRGKKTIVKRERGVAGCCVGLVHGEVGLSKECGYFGMADKSVNGDHCEGRGAKRIFSIETVNIDVLYIYTVEKKNFFSCLYVCKIYIFLKIYITLLHFSFLDIFEIFFES